ncbi:MAG TPA: exonuclease SbcCD subunit D [Gemmatimonadales bacterium]
MKLAHIADLHLGYRQYPRQTPHGINQREADVAGAFRRALDAIIEEGPDLILVAGDVFHSVRPTNVAILDSFHQFRRLREALPKTPVVIIAGNHDTPRSVETGSILKLFSVLGGVHVVAHASRRVVFEDLDTAVLCVPNHAWSGVPRPAVAPDPAVRWNILMTHREVEGALPADPSMLGYGGTPIKHADVHAEEFDYVALGHYHVATAVEPNMWYAGSLEYVTTNPWGESRERGSASGVGRKGWLSVAFTDQAEVTFHAIDLARRVIDLDPIHGAGLAAAEIDGQIAHRVSGVAGGIEGQIVRQVVYDVPRITARDLDHAAVREWKTRALHYRLDLRRPDEPRQIGVGAPGRRQTLPEILAEFLQQRTLPAEVPRERLLALAAHYLDAVEETDGGA